MEDKVKKLIFELNGNPTPILIDHGDHCEWFTAIAIIDPTMDPMEKGIKFVSENTIVNQISLEEIESIEICYERTNINGVFKRTSSLEIKHK